VWPELHAQLLDPPVIDNITFHIHGSPYGTTRAPFTRQRSGLPHELAHCVIPEWGQLMLRCLLLLAYLLAFTYFSDQFDRDAALALISPT